MANQVTGETTASQPISGISTSTSLSDRAARYREEIEKVVTQVGEHPLCEMKRACSLQSLADKIEFVKDIQSIATSRIQSEKFLIIGADETAKAFYAVQNQAELDEATMRQVLDKYLDPIPDIEVFKLASSEGSPFILIVIPETENPQNPCEGNYRRPIQPKAEKYYCVRETCGRKVHLRASGWPNLKTGTTFTTKSSRLE